jgi:predicted aldo/keto reductase-like oxidoreductase
MVDPERADSYIRSSGRERMRRVDAGILREYVRANTRLQCRFGCSACESSCPAAVPISDVLRQRMYAVRYQNTELAAAGYAKLGAGAAACLSCTTQSCLAACPYELDVPAMTRETAKLLG